MHALIRKIDAVSKEIKEVEMVCILPHQAGSWTKKKAKKDNPIHFGWTPPLIFHYKRTKK